jgi:glycosyltransferase involved in cell wall biosynthesis
MKLAQSPQPLISIVVISTRAANLTANLQAIFEAAQAIESAEVILVCQGYHPDLSFLSARLSLKVLYSPMLLGISRARNAGADYACGQFISFLDDDIHPDRTFYQRTIATLQAHPEHVGVLGALQVTDNPMSNLFGKFRRPGTSQLGQFDLWRLANGNTGVFLRTGLRFDPRLGVGTSFGSFEDGDYLLSIARLGTLSYLPEAVLFHPDMTEKDTYDARRMRQYGRGLGGCLRKNMGISGAIFFAASFINNLLMFLRIRPYPSLVARWSHLQAAGAKMTGWLQWRNELSVCVESGVIVGIIGLIDVKPPKSFSREAL